MTDLRQPDTSTPSEVAPPSASVEHGHELRDIRARPIVYAGIGLAVAGLTVLLLMLLVLNLLASRASKESAPASPLAGAYGLKAPPQPRLQTEPRGDLAQLRAAEDATLHGYGWVDRQAGIVRIPIERAIDLVVNTYADNIPRGAVGVSPAVSAVMGGAAGGAQAPPQAAPGESGDGGHAP